MRNLELAGLGGFSVAGMGSKRVNDELEALKGGSITVGHGTLLAVIAAVISATVWVTTYATNSQGTAHDLTQFEANVTSQLADIRSGFTAGLTSIQQQVSILPDQRARLDQVERRINDLETAHQDDGQRLEAIELSIAELRADLQLPPSRALPTPSIAPRYKPRQPQQ